MSEWHYLGITMDEKDLIDPEIEKRYKLWLSHRKDLSFMDDLKSAIYDISRLLRESMTQEEWSKALPETIEFQRWQYYKCKWKFDTVFPSANYVSYIGKKGPSMFEYETCDCTSRRCDINRRLCTAKEIRRQKHE